MHGFFSVGGFKTLAVDGSRGPLQRRQIINKWNDPETDIQVLVTSLAISNSGIDLHKCCSTAIFMCLHYNGANLDHAMGRLIRIGQTRPVEITILKTTGSFMDYQEKSMMDKYVPIRAAEISRSIPLTGIAYMMFCYEHVRESWGQSFNRFAWVLLDEWEPEGLVQDPGYFNAPVTILVGHMISSVVRYMLQLEPKAQQRLEEALFMAEPVLRHEAEKMLKQKGDLGNLGDDILSHFEDIELFDRDWSAIFGMAMENPDQRQAFMKAEQNARQVHEDFTRRMAEREESNEQEYDEETGDRFEEREMVEAPCDESEGSADEDEGEDDGTGGGEGD